MRAWRFYFISCLNAILFGMGSCVVSTVCEYYVSPTLPTSIQVESAFNKSGNISQDGTYMTCHHDYGQCMVLWSFDHHNPNVTAVLFKGCWKGNGDCERSECIAHDDINTRYLNNSRFCCCSSSRCNANFTFVWMPKNYTRLSIFSGIPTKLASSNYATVIIVAVVGFVVLLLLTFGAVWVLRSFTRHRDRMLKEKMASANGNGTDREHLLKSADMALSQPKLLLDGDQIDLLEIISSGRFSTVWKSLYKTTGEYVAVKIYSPTYRPYFYNEHQIYSWMCVKQENIVRFFGGTERSGPSDDQEKAAGENRDNPFYFHNAALYPQYWIVTEYMPQGTLQEFLKANTVDWEEMCKMGASIACGLSYLHGGVSKPPIVHRDVNSRNVLVKPDGTCALCDFGFAMVLEEPKGGSSAPHSDTPLTEVGTVRYFAPEILEGAVNLRDPATALKQVDIYAFGLVLWEIVSRCAPIYRLSDHAVSEYQPPFAKEIGQHQAMENDPQPRMLEQMQLWVCKKKIRPLFPQAFYKFNIGALRVLRILIEDCWDTDSEARITASCAHERLVGLQSLASVFGSGRDGDGILNAKPFGSSELVSPYSRYLSYPELRRQLQFIGGESTVDTGATSGLGSMCLNSSDRGRSINSSHSYRTTALDSPATLQPYQGRNPCMERNLHVESSDDSSQGKNRVSESQFQKIDPCSPDALARFASPALIALATRDDTCAVGERNKAGEGQCLGLTAPTSPSGAREIRLTAAEKGNALAFILMKSEKNRNSRDEANRQQRESETVKRNDSTSGEEQVGGTVMNTTVVDFRGSVSGSSNDSGNCTTSSSRSGTDSASPKLRVHEAKTDCVHA